VSGILKEIVEQYGVIVRVTGYSKMAPEPANPNPKFDEIELSFEHGLITVSVDTDDDTLLLSSSSNSLPEQTDITFHEPWKRFVGCPVLWAWLMENQSGYLDGLQIEFKVKDGFAALQFMCEASAISLRVVET
jgi:hypothetical protein